MSIDKINELKEEIIKLKNQLYNKQDELKLEEYKMTANNSSIVESIKSKYLNRAFFKFNTYDNSITMIYILDVYLDADCKDHYKITYNYIHHNYKTHHFAIEEDLYAIHEDWPFNHFNEITIYEYKENLKHIFNLYDV